MIRNPTPKDPDTLTGVMQTQSHINQTYRASEFHPLKMMPGVDELLNMRLRPGEISFVGHFCE